MTRVRKNHVRVYLNDAAYLRLKQHSDRTKIPISLLIEAALDKNTVETLDYMVHAAAKYAYLAASLSLQQAAISFEPAEFKRRLEAVSGAFNGIFGPSPNIPEEIRKRMDQVQDSFIQDFAKVLLAHVDPADSGTIL